MDNFFDSIPVDADKPDNFFDSIPVEKPGGNFFDSVPVSSAAAAATPESASPQDQSGPDAKPWHALRSDAERLAVKGDEITPEDAEVVRQAAANGKPVVMVNGKPTVGEKPTNAPLSTGDRVAQGAESSLGTTALRALAGLSRIAATATTDTDVYTDTSLADSLSKDAADWQKQQPDDTASKIGRGIGSAAGLIASGGLTGAMANIGLQSQAEKLSFGAALKSVPELAAYWLLGMGASKAVGPLIEQSSPFIKTLASSAAATAANMASSAGIRMVNGQPVMPDAESLAQDALFGFGAHGMEAGKAAVQDRAAVVKMLETAPDDALRMAASDPDFRKSSPYDPKLIDAEIARRDAATPQAAAVAPLKQAASAAQEIAPNTAKASEEAAAIIEQKASSPSPRVEPPVISGDAGAQVEAAKGEPSEAVAPATEGGAVKPEQVKMSGADAYDFAEWARGKTVGELRQLRDDHESEPGTKSDHTIELINQVIAERSKTLKASVAAPQGEQPISSPSADAERAAAQRESAAEPPVATAGGDAAPEIELGAREKELAAMSDKDPMKPLIAGRIKELRAVIEQQKASHEIPGGLAKSASEQQVPTMPEDNRAASTSGQPSPSGQEARALRLTDGDIYKVLEDDFNTSTPNEKQEIDGRNKAAVQSLLTESGYEVHRSKWGTWYITDPRSRLTVRVGDHETPASSHSRELVSDNPDENIVTDDWLLGITHAFDWFREQDKKEPPHDVLSSEHEEARSHKNSPVKGNANDAIINGTSTPTISDQNVNPENRALGEGASEAINEIPKTASEPPAVQSRVETPARVQPIARGEDVAIPPKTAAAEAAAPELKQHQSKFFEDIDTELADEPAAGKALSTSENAAKPKRAFSFAHTSGDPYFEQDHIIGRLMEDGIVSKSAAKEKLGKEGYARNAGEYEDLPKLSNPKHNRIYKPGGRTPDQAVQDLIDAKLVPENYSVSDLAEHIRKTSASAERMRKDAAAQSHDVKAREKQEKDFGKDSAKPAGGEPINANDLKEGDAVKIGDETLKVIHVDEDGAVTLDDGKKYGVQQVNEGETIYGELTVAPKAEPMFLDPKEIDEARSTAKITTPEEAEAHAKQHQLDTAGRQVAARAPAEDAPAREADAQGQGGPGAAGGEKVGPYTADYSAGAFGADQVVTVRDSNGRVIGQRDPFWTKGIPSSEKGRAAAVQETVRAIISEHESKETPKLRPGEKGTAELFQGEDQPFNLAGETGTDFQRVADEKAAAEKAAAEAKAKQDREQLDIFAEKPKAEQSEKLDPKKVRAEATKLPESIGQVIINVLNKGRSIEDAAAESGVTVKQATEAVERVRAYLAKAKTVEPLKPGSYEQESSTERAEPETEKEPWQKTRDEVKSEGGMLAKHGAQVQEALKQGKQVPLEVLESFDGRKWADDARRKLYGADISPSAFDKILKALESEDGGKLYSDPLLLKTMIEHVGKPVLRAAVKIAREGLEAGKVAADAVNDAITYLKANVKNFDERLGRKFFDPLINEPQPEKITEQPLPGMEKPKAEPLTVEDGQRQTSTKNDVMDAERAARGLEPIDAPARQAVGEVWDKAGRDLARDTDAGRKLVRETLKNPHGPISTEEEAILLRYKVGLQNEIHDAVTTAADESKSLGDRQEASFRAAALLDENNDLDMATRARGTVWGRLGQFRQQLANEDFTLAPMLQRARAANGGTELPPDRIQQITDWQKQYEDLKTKFDAHLADAEKARSERAATDKIKAMMDEAKKKEKTPNTKKTPLSKSVVDFVDTQMEAARQRMRERHSKLFADPLGFNMALDSADALIIGAGHIVKGTVRFGKWSAAMVKEFGDDIKPHLRDLHEQAEKQADQLRSEAPRDIAAERKATTEGIKARLAEGDEMPDLARYVQSLAEQFVASGITSRDLLIDAVHQELKQIKPDITRRETMDAISGYGDYKELNHDAVKTELRDLKGQMQQVAKIEDMEKGEAPKKTGVERRSPSDEERRLTQRVNELKKLGGYTVTDPAKQLKSSLDAIKSRLKNQISDLDHQIATGKKIIREKNAPPSDAETESLRAQRDAKKHEFAEIFGKPELTDAQRIDIATKAAERGIAEYEKRIADAKGGKFDTKKASTTPETPELTALLARRDAMKAEYDELRNLSKPRPTAEDIAAGKAQKGVDAAAAALDRWDRIVRGEIEPETKAASEPKSNLEEELRAQVEAIKEAYRESKKPRTDVEAKREETKIKALEKATEEYIRKASEGDLATKGKRQGQDTARIAAAKEARDAARKVVEDMRKASQPKKSPDEIALAAYKTRTANRIAELQEKLAAGDFTPNPKPAPVKMDAEGLKLKGQMEKVKLDYDRANMRDMLSHRSKTEKFLDWFPKASRAFLLSSPATLAKLTAAATWRMALTPAEEGIGSGLRRLPFISQVAERAPRQGGGFNVRAESKALTKGVTEGARDAWQLLTKGETALGALAGKRNIMPHEWIDFIGNIHGALKSIPKRNEFERSFQQRSEFNMRHGIDMSDPLVQARTMIEAYKDAERSIFQQDNALVSRYNRFLTSLEEKQKATGKPSMGLKALQAGLKTVFPIVKVPTNIVAEAFEYAAGSAIGSVKVARAFKNGIDTLKPEEADIIMRQLKKGSLGGAILALGFLAPQVIGGFYQAGKKRRESDVQAGHVRLYGQDIPPNLIHAPALEMMQVGATVRRVADSKLRKRDKDSQGVPAGILAGGLGLVDEVPFVRDTVELSKAFNPYERGQWASEFAKSRLEPQLVKWIAEQTDRQNGEPVKRKPEGFVETMKTGIPGLREQVPKKKH